MLRNRLAKATEKCDKWTISLLEELQESIQVGKSMIAKFIDEYSEKKEKFYMSWCTFSTKYAAYKYIVRVLIFQIILI